MTNRQRVFLALAFFAGAGLWVVVGALTGKRESWDSTLYFRYLLPTVYVLSAGLAYCEPRRWLLLGFAPFAGQFAALFATAGAGSLVPLGLLALTVLSIPAVVLARLAALLRTRSPSTPENPCPPRPSP